MSKLVADTGENVAVEVPTRWGTSARVVVQDEQGRLLVSVAVTTYNAGASRETKVIVESNAARLDLNGSDVASERIVFTTRSA